MHSRHVLLVEDNAAVQRTLQRMLEEDGYRAICAASKQEMLRILANEEPDTLLACLLDYCLPDAPEGEALPELIARHIPTIVLTARNDLATREQVLLQPVVDYIPKENPAAYEYTLRMLHRIEHNPGTRVLVVDDSSAIRGYLRQLLQRQLYEVVEASRWRNGAGAAGERSGHPPGAYRPRHAGHERRAAVQRDPPLPRHWRSGHHRHIQQPGPEHERTLHQGRGG